MNEGRKKNGTYTELGKYCAYSWKNWNSERKVNKKTKDSMGENNWYIWMGKYLTGHLYSSVTTFILW